MKMIEKEFIVKPDQVDYTIGNHFWDLLEVTFSLPFVYAIVARV